MKFSTVKLENTRSGWVVSFTDIPGDKLGYDYGPNPTLGTYIYPRHIGREKALERLKAAMMNRMSYELEYLSTSLNMLKHVEINDEVAI